MNQDAFRSLLGGSSTSTASTTSRGSISNPKKSTHADANSTQKSAEDKAAFKPRKLNSKFRDRAAERREGINDYAEIEGILEDFEKRNAGADRVTIDEQRKYLGGDADHSILVKGLDFALLEQNKARATVEEEANAEAALDAALSGKPLPDQPPGPSTAMPSTSTKRTREQRIADLKRRRDEAKNGSSTSLAPSAEVDKLEKAKQMGKFRPIGAPPPNPVKEPKSEKRKKKKRKVGIEAPEVLATDRRENTALPTTSASVSASEPLLPQVQAPLPFSDPKLASKPAPEPHSASPSSPPPTSNPLPATTSLKNQPGPVVNESDEDIFADAGSYKGFASGGSSDSDIQSDSGESDREEDHTKQTEPQRRSESHLDTKVQEDTPRVGHWFGNDPDLTSLISHPAVESPRRDQAARGISNQRQRSESLPAQESTSRTRDAEDGEEAESAVPPRLQPLSSSLSITELLEMDKQAEADEKRRVRKAKRKAAAESGTGEPTEKAPKKKLDRNQKLQRDYQQYMSYTEKGSKSEPSK